MKSTTIGSASRSTKGSIITWSSTWLSWYWRTITRTLYQRTPMGRWRSTRAKSTILIPSSWSMKHSRMLSSCVAWNRTQEDISEFGSPSCTKPKYYRYRTASTSEITQTTTCSWLSYPEAPLPKTTSTVTTMGCTGRMGIVLPITPTRLRRTIN